jgi:16S rRNA (guanine966-N2)-methyltransferase
MRIIAGIRRGHKLVEPEGMAVRPTTDRVKESMFNLLMPYLPDSRVLDLFSGSGALACEAVSRGAREAVCVDQDKRSVEVIRKNRDSLHFEQQIQIIHQSAEAYLKSADGMFDLILLDPPYNQGLIKPVLKAIVRQERLAEDGVVLLESDSTDDRPEVDGLSVIKQRRYGRTYVTVYKKEIKG